MYINMYIHLWLSMRLPDIERRATIDVACGNNITYFNIYRIVTTHSNNNNIIIV